MSEQVNICLVFVGWTLETQNCVLGFQRLCFFLKAMLENTAKMYVCMNCLYQKKRERWFSAMVGRKIIIFYLKLSVPKLLTGCVFEPVDTQAAECGVPLYGWS